MWHAHCTRQPLLPLVVLVGWPCLLISRSHEISSHRCRSMMMRMWHENSPRLPLLLLLLLLGRLR